YWARSMVGWPRMLEARPNAAHRALASLERHGLIAGLLTQNVDRLHTEAGSRNLVELHGALAEVVCLDCRALEPRAQLQQRLLALNPDFDTTAAEVAPDGDAELSHSVDSFRVASCLHCGGTLKPNVVFFGENVPAEVKNTAFEMMAAADALLIVGSS